MESASSRESGAPRSSRRDDRRATSPTIASWIVSIRSANELVSALKAADRASIRSASVFS